MSYITENFMLSGTNARKLYEYAKDMPIFDYHCHLSEKEILADEPFRDIAQIWLGGDHYKWRLMRFYGIDERFITGDASPREKFGAYVSAVSRAFGNPLQHWSQMELKEFFGIEEELRPENAEIIWNKANAYIAEHRLRPSDCIKNSDVRIIFTTNEVYDDLSVFEKIREKNYPFKVCPAFRADKLMAIESEGYTATLSKLEELTGKVSDLNGLENAITKRLAEFKTAGCVAADIATEKCYAPCSKQIASEIFSKRINGESVTAREAESFRSYLTVFLMELYAEENIVAEYHLGAMRNNNSPAFTAIGADSGFDTIGGGDYIENMSRLLDKLCSDGKMPKMVLFNLNPNRNAEFIALSGCFCDGTAKCKVNYGAAWWFLDNKPGMEKHLTDLGAMGHIDTFLGMLTDSRSFLSYPRHDYFRRILCNFLGKLMDDGLMTDDVAFVGETVRNICYRNAMSFFGQHA